MPIAQPAPLATVLTETESASSLKFAAIISFLEAKSVIRPEVVLLFLILF